MLEVKTAANNGETRGTATMKLFCHKKPLEEYSDGYHRLY